MLKLLRRLFAKLKPPEACTVAAPEEQQNFLKVEDIIELQVTQTEDNKDTIQNTVPVQCVAIDENLLERSRTQWQFGDWQSLAQLNRDTLQHHPDRAKLALLAAAGRLQVGQDAEANAYISLAHDWGVSKKLISQILIAGVHNSIARAAAICNQQQRALQHFESSIQIGTPGADTKLLTQARIQHQLAQLPIVGQGQPSIRLDHAPFAVPPAPTFTNDLYAVLAELHETIDPNFYLEIGVGRGRSLALAKCKAIGVDPVPQERLLFGPNIQIITASSDEFFAEQAEQVLTTQPDLVLLDGMPLVDYVLRDFLAIESRALPHTFIAISGIFPRIAETATRHRTSADWLGDIWKLPEILRTYRPDLQLLALDTEPAGLLLVCGLDPKNTVLKEKYKELIPLMQKIEPPPLEIIQRANAASIEGSHYNAYLQNFRDIKA